MTPTERRAVSREFAQRSDREFDHGGNTMIAAELLWGAVAQSLLAIAEDNSWPCQGHGGYFQVARRLAEQQHNVTWQSDTAAADQLHRHFYNRNLQPAELESRRYAAQRALQRVITLPPAQ